MANTTGRKPRKEVAHTDSPSSYTLLLSGCTNYAFYVFHARRNRRNSPSMARFLLALPSMAGHFCVSMHNSTATKQLRYALSRESVCAIASPMHHYWKYDPASTDSDGCIHYLMVAFNHSLVVRCMEVFPELRNRLINLTFPVNALKFGPESSRVIRNMLSQMNDMDDLGRLCGMFRLLPVIFNSPDHIFAGKPMQIERDVRRMQQICTYVMAHYVHTITLDEIAAEIGMNRSAFCSYFKRCKGMTFSQFVTQYRLNTACELLKHSQKQVSEICFAVGFNDVPHFNRVFKESQGITPKEYRKRNT